jgi:glycerol uptake facilitator-like aquaporin
MRTPSVAPYSIATIQGALAFRVLVLVWYASFSKKMEGI